MFKTNILCVSWCSNIFWRMEGLDMKRNYRKIIVFCITGLFLSGCGKAQPGESLSGINKEIFLYAKEIEDKSLKNDIELTGSVVFCKDSEKRVILVYDIFYDNGAKDSNIVEYYISKDGDQVKCIDYSEHDSNSLQMQYDNLILNQYLLDAKTLVAEGKFIDYEEYNDFNEGVLTADLELINAELVKYQEK